MNTIREQIISAVMSKLAIIRTANGFNTDIGSNPLRVRAKLDPDEFPASVVWPKLEEAGRQYGSGVHEMPLQVEGQMLHGLENPSVVSEMMLGDLIEAMAGIVWTQAFTGGGTYEVEVGDTVTGHISGAAGFVQAVAVASGTWAAGDVVGTLTLRRVTGRFQAENLDVGANLNVATIAGMPTGQGPIATTLGGLAEGLEFAGGGIDEYPEGGDQATGVVTKWNVKYRTLNGDPYHQ